MISARMVPRPVQCAAPSIRSLPAGISTVRLDSVRVIASTTWVRPAGPPQLPGGELNTHDSVVVEHRFIGVQTHPGVDRLIPQEPPDNFFVVTGDGDELDRLVFELVRQLIQMRYCGNAGPAPGGSSVAGGR